MEIGGPTAGRAVPFDADRPRASHAELRGRGKPSRHTRRLYLHIPGRDHAGHRHVRADAHRAHIEEGAGRGSELDREGIAAVSQDAGRRQDHDVHVA